MCPLARVEFVLYDSEATQLRRGPDAVRCAAGFRHRHTDSLLYEPTGLSLSLSLFQAVEYPTRDTVLSAISCELALVFFPPRFPDPEYKKIATGVDRAKKATGN